MGIKEDLEDIKKRLGEREREGVKAKKWKFPAGKKVGKSQKKKNYVTVMIIKTNGLYDFKKYQIDEQTILHETIPRLATAGHVLFDKKGNPLVVLPEWSVEPFSPKQHFESSLENGSNIVGYRILMNKMKLEQVSPKKQISGMVKWIFGLGFLALIVYAAMTGGG